ncbi:MAG: HAD family hydrolase [Candidatus Lokiarchaeota archaeon]|nr:HAD family hydrolase [Candidatus Lokiarchaeota archaeon]
MTIKGIIFDFGFTLFYFDNPSVERYRECFKKGLLKSIDLLKEKQVWNEKISEDLLIKTFAKKREQYWREGRKTKKEFPTSLIYREVLESLQEENFVNKIDHLEDDTYEKLAEMYHSFEQEEWKPFPKTKETLEKLSKDENIKLAVLSNHPNHTMVENSLKNYDLFAYFDAVVTSAEFGKRKPDPEIFFYTLEKMGLTEHSETMVCGDEYADIIGGDRAGMHTILCERKYKFPFERELDVPELIRIDNVSEILEHLD